MDRRHVAGRARSRILATAAVMVLLALLAGMAILRWRSHTSGRPRAEAAARLGPVRSGLAWHSGSYPAGEWSASRAAQFGAWRGAPLDIVTTYGERSSYARLANTTWHITTWAGFPGRLSYGLPMLTDDNRGSFRAIARGENDATWARVAQSLLNANRGSSVVRIGWEANGDWWAWKTTAQTAADYKRAFRRIAVTMKRVAPDLLIDFDIACGTPLKGQSTRVGALTQMYPGDDVVDVVGCDVYDWYATKSTDQASWDRALRPADSVGLQDVADFARAHGKMLSVPEWGVAAPSAGGAGDNPFFIERMWAFFEANQEILAFEAYFNQHDGFPHSSLWVGQTNPQSAAAYRWLWSGHDAS